DSYIAHLVRLGHRVAICEQMEDPRTAKGIVRREVVRVVSPGTLTDPAALESRLATYVAAVTVARGTVGLALADLSTGEFRAWEGDPARAREILSGYAPSEVIHAEAELEAAPLVQGLSPGPLLSPRPPWTFTEPAGRKALMSHFSVLTLDGYGLSGKALAVAAAGALLAFLQETQRSPLGHIEPPRLLDAASCLVLDQTTRRNLELTRQLGEPDGRATLIATLDLTLTPMGGRLLRDWILRPLVGRHPIEARHTAVDELVEERSLREALRERLRQVPDLERLLGRVAVGAAGPRDLVAVRR